MPEPTTLLLFAAATVALLIIPGPSVLFVVARTLEHGRTGGLVSALGLEVGALLHVAAASLGLSAVIAASPAALLAIRLGGAAYLIAMGIANLSPNREIAHGASAPARAGSARRLFLQGVLVDALNPKTALFFLAFLPQFVDPAGGSVAVQVAVLGLVFVALAAAHDCAYALVTGAVATRMDRGLRATGALRRVSGAAYLGLAALTALSPA
jgi:threonine/homoserine/homoserine lactone efflux protein